jgi:hypothetical protein
MPCVNEKQFYSVIYNFLEPVVNSEAEDSLNQCFRDAISKASSHKICISGDCRYDSTANARFCTETLLSEDGHAIASITLNKHEEKLNSQSLEKEAMKQLLQSMQNRGSINYVSQFVYDINNTIMNLIQQYIPNVHCIYDFWHVQKSTKKKIKSQALSFLHSDEVTLVLNSFDNFLNNLHYISDSTLDFGKELNIFVDHLFGYHDRCHDHYNCQIFHNYEGVLEHESDNSEVYKKLKSIFQDN